MKHLTTARDFCNEWQRRASEATGTRYVVNRMSDGAVFKRLMAKFPNSTISKLINFSFSGHKLTSFLKSQGYSIRLLPSQVNAFLNAISNPGVEIVPWELDLEVPYWKDTRIEFLYMSIAIGDIDTLIDRIRGEYNWALLMEKMRVQAGGVPEKVTLFYEMWKIKERFNRTRIKHED
jgi:hypothetical protein